VRVVRVPVRMGLHAQAAALLGVARMQRPPIQCTLCAARGVCMLLLLLLLLQQAAALNRLIKVRRTHAAATASLSLTDTAVAHRPGLLRLARQALHDTCCACCACSCSCYPLLSRTPCRTHQAKRGKQQQKQQAVLQELQDQVMSQVRGRQMVTGGGGLLQAHQSLHALAQAQPPVSSHTCVSTHPTCRMCSCMTLRCMQTRTPRTLKRWSQGEMALEVERGWGGLGGSTRTASMSACIGQHADCMSQSAGCPVHTCPHTPRHSHSTFNSLSKKLTEKFKAIEAINQRYQQVWGVRCDEWLWLWLWLWPRAAVALWTASSGISRP
jgi:hypothetical protein